VRAKFDQGNFHRAMFVILAYTLVGYTLSIRFIAGTVIGLSRMRCTSLSRQFFHLGSDWAEWAE
jgi:hypothetical protein